MGVPGVALSAAESAAGARVRNRHAPLRFLHQSGGAKDECDASSATPHAAASSIGTSGFTHLRAQHAHARPGNREDRAEVAGTVRPLNGFPHPLDGTQRAARSSRRGGSSTAISNPKM